MIGLVEINYKNGLEKEQIDNAVFSFVEEKSLVLSAEDIYDENDNEKIIGQKLKLLVRDSNYGIEDLFVELSLEVGKDVLKIIQKMLRQIGNAN